MYKIMSAGPTQVRENVRAARSRITTNPDVDVEFCEYYKSICDKLENVVNCSGTAYVLGGEGILSLEAACATLTEPGDRVLVIDNGIFGHGFADFVEMYGGKAVLFTTDYQYSVNPEELRAFLQKDSDFKYATVVHCDTPTGVLNPIEVICPLLAEFGIMSVVDSVAAMFAEPVDMDNSCIDVLCGGSQKVMSAPPGLAMVWVSDKAMKAMRSRKTPVAGFYTNILTFSTYYEDKWFPYTMPISDINGFGVALDNLIEDKNIINRHESIAAACRKAVTEAGLSMYVKNGFANTVTAIEVPEGVTDVQILNTMRDKHNILISGCFDILAGKIVRIGHMGENANIPDMIETLKALDATFVELGVTLKCSMSRVFAEEMIKTIL